MDLVTAIDEYLASLGSERGMARNTLAAYRRDLHQYRSYLRDAGTTGLDDVTSDHIEAFLASLTTAGAAATTVRRKLAALRGLHRFAIAEAVTERDPTAAVETPQPPRGLPKALSIADVEALLDAPVPNTTLGIRDRALLEFLYASAARVSEAVRIELSDLDLDARNALVTGKGNKQRVVPLGRPAVEAIRTYLPVRLEMKRGIADPGWLFLNARGGRLTRQGVFGIVRKHARIAGIDESAVSPHVLRHSAATHMVEGGADLRTVQEILGHANISTTQVYTRVSPRYLYEVFVTAHPRSG